MSQAQAMTRPKSMSINDMFLLDTKQYGKMGIEGYDCPHIYQDASKQIKDRQYAEYRKKNKFPKSTIQPLKIKNHLEELIAYKKGFPGPNKYKTDKPWVSKQDIEKGKRMPKDTTRMSYIDAIVKEQKLRSVPGVGKYNVIKTEEQVKKEVETIKQKNRRLPVTDRILDVDAVQFVAAQIPGPGQYNPRKEIVKIQKNRTQPKDWIAKHRSQSANGLDKKGKSSAPDPGTYTHQPAAFDTFGKLDATIKAGKKPHQNKIMGTSERFSDPRKTKSMVKKVGVAPNHYDMRAQWLGKEEGNKGKKKDTHNWMNRISRGISKSIYY